MTSALQLARRGCLIVAFVSLVALAVGLVLRRPAAWQPAAVAVGVALALGLGAIPRMRGYQFTAWIVAAVTAAMVYPAAFQHWGPVELRNRWLLLVVIQLVMFGMGTQMSLRDLAGVVRMPLGVFIGIVGHFTIMPLTGYALTRLFTFPPEIAAGIILIGSCSSGLASNVMTYLARGNVALSVTVTTAGTLLAPLLTPLWMKLLAGAYVEVSFVKMMMEIVNIVLVPVGAALINDYLRHGSRRGRRVVGVTAVVALVYLLCLPFVRRTVVASAGGEALLITAGFLLGAVLGGIVYHWLTGHVAALDRSMPRISMFGIIYFTTVTTAAGRDNLLLVGGLLFLAAALHNLAGYLFGYLVSRACGLDKTSARTIAIEVGLQNGGMASGLAGAMGKLGTVGLAAAIFSPWMNVSGSVLANYWRRRPVENPPVEPLTQETARPGVGGRRVG
jgi:BASS family bile acid:Na+ symporter